MDDQGDDSQAWICHISSRPIIQIASFLYVPRALNPRTFFRIFLVVEPQNAANSRDITGDHAGVMPLRWPAKISPSIWANRILQC